MTTRCGRTCFWLRAGHMVNSATRWRASTRCWSPTGSSLPQSAAPTRSGTWRRACRCCWRWATPFAGRARPCSPCCRPAASCCAPTPCCAPRHKACGGWCPPRPRAASCFPQMTGWAARETTWAPLPWALSSPMAPSASAATWPPPLVARGEAVWWARAWAPQRWARPARRTLSAALRWASVSVGWAASTGLAAPCWRARR
mmetsp:Transcript_12932/g.41306  ORF Transcript_12932/g.41306 Transcript_12932/m.41306 type:complete len:201 (+) Transcript_12932:445-1047(+)